MTELKKSIAWHKSVKSVEWKDRHEIMKEYPYIKEDEEKEELYVEVVEDGKKKKKYITLPYIPDPISQYTVRILFQKRAGAENKPFEYTKIDNDKELLDLFINNEVGVLEWRKEAQNRDVNKRKEQNILDKDRADTYRYEVRAIRCVDFITYLQEKWDKWNILHSTTNLPLHKFVVINNSKNEMVEYSKQNSTTSSKRGAGKVQIDHFNNDTLDNRYFNLSSCFDGENYKPEVDQDAGLNNYTLFYDKDEKGNIIERRFVKNKDGKNVIENDNKKYCIICSCNGYELPNGQKTTTLIEIKDGKSIVARAEIVMFIFDSLQELKEVVSRVRLEKKETERIGGHRVAVNELKNKRNSEIANVLQDMLTVENIRNKRVFAFAEDNRYILDKEKIGLIDVCRKDKDGQAVVVGVEKRKQFAEAGGVERIDYKNILDLFYYDIEKYIKEQ